MVLSLPHWLQFKIQDELTTPMSLHTSRKTLDTKTNAYLLKESKKILSAFDQFLGRIDKDLDPICSRCKRTKNEREANSLWQKLIKFSWILSIDTRWFLYQGSSWKYASSSVWSIRPGYWIAVNEGGLIPSTATTIWLPVSQPLDFQWCLVCLAQLAS